MIPRTQPNDLAWILSIPVLLSWGFGTVHPVLDYAALPGATILAAPAAWGIPGMIIALTVVAIGPRSRGLDRIVGVIGGIALLAHAIAAVRPFGWVILACGLLQLRARDSGTSPAPRAWRVPPSVVPWLGLGAWFAASRARPWGDGLVPEAVLRRVGLLIEGFPTRSGEPAVFALAIVAAAVLWRRSPPNRRTALVGAILAVLAAATFGRRSAYLSAAAIGIVAGGWPVPLRPSSSDRLPALSVALFPLIALCALGGVRMGAIERWNCEVPGLDKATSWWITESDVQSLAVVSGNLPYLAILRGEGEELARLGAARVVDETRSLDPPGGILASTGVDSLVARVVEVPAGLKVEWWDIANMRESHSRVVAGACRPVDVRMKLAGTIVRVACTNGRVLEVGPTEEPARELHATSRRPTSLGGSDFVLRGGTFARALFQSSDGATVGPWTRGLGQGPSQLLVARGPAGQLEVRGWGPDFGADRTPPERARHALRNTLDRVRVGTWPSAVRWNGYTESAYVTSELDGRVWLVDPVVTWHQASAAIGAPPRQVVVEGSSGTLFGANRCGVFEVRIRSTFPWRSSGDVEVIKKE